MEEDKEQRGKEKAKWGRAVEAKRDEWDWGEEEGTEKCGRRKSHVTRDFDKAIEKEINGEEVLMVWGNDWRMEVDNHKTEAQVGKCGRRKRRVWQPGQREERPDGWRLLNRAMQSRVKQRDDANKARGRNLLHCREVHSLLWSHRRTKRSHHPRKNKHAEQFTQPSN